MPLVISLRTGERLFVGRAVIVNHGGKAQLIVENGAPFLREKHLMLPEQADTICKSIYLLIQNVYLGSVDVFDAEEKLLPLVSDVARAAPSANLLLTLLSDRILAGDYYEALRVSRELVAHEALLLGSITGTPGLEHASFTSSDLH